MRCVAPTQVRSRLSTQNARQTKYAFTRSQKRSSNRRQKSSFRNHASADDSSSESSNDLTTGLAHDEYLRSVAATPPPAELGALIAVLQAQGATPVLPSEREGLHPLCIPLARNSDESVTCLKLNVEDTAIEVVNAVDGVHLSLLSKNCKEYVVKAMVVEEAEANENGDDKSDAIIATAAGAIGASLYEPGAFTTLGKDIPTYLTLRVGKFPEQMEQLTQKHLSKSPSDEMSAFVTCDLYKSTFGFWGRPHWYLSNIYERLDRKEESRDCARFALTDCEWSTLGSVEDLNECLERSGWSGKTVDEVKEIIDTRRGPNRDAFDGPKTDAQVAEELALTLLDKVAFGELSTKEVIQRLAECYSTAEKPGLAKLVMSAYSL